MIILAAVALIFSVVMVFGAFVAAAIAVLHAGAYMEDECE